MCVVAERRVGASADVVYGYLADMCKHHPRFLPPAFSAFAVESGGVGAGTVVRFKLTAGGRTREYRTKVEEPEPGRVLQEIDTASTTVTTFTVIPAGSDCRVRIATQWDGTTGIAGAVERLFAPGVLRRIYRQELDLLDAYARQRSDPAST